METVKSMKNDVPMMKATTISLSEENHWLLQRYKEGAGLRSFNDAVRALLDGGPHTVWHLIVARRDLVRRACKELGITGLTAFGSRVKGCAHGLSDLDLVADFAPGIDLMDVVAAQDALSEAFGVAVDLHTWNGLKPRIAERIRREGVDILA